MIRAVLVLTDAVSVFDTASAVVGDVEVAACGELVELAGSVVVAVVPVPLVVGVVVAACGEFAESVEVDVFVGGVGSGSGFGVASVVKVSSVVIAALPEESITITR